MPMMHSPGFTRLLAPTDNRKIEFRDQTIRERHAGKTGQAQCALRFAHLNPSAPRQRALATAIAADPTIRRGILKDINGECGTGANNQWASEQGVGGQRHQLQRLHVRPHDRSSGGERVCG